jgi:hypothetical protein
MTIFDFKGNKKKKNRIKLIHYSLLEKFEYFLGISFLIRIKIIKI